MKRDLTHFLHALYKEWVPSGKKVSSVTSGYMNLLMTLTRTISVFALLAGLAIGQTQRILGVVTQVDAAAKLLSVKNDQGEIFAVGVQETAKVVKTAPGAKDLKDSQTIALSGVLVGDRVIATGLLNPQLKTLEAQRVIVMANAEIVKKHERDKAEWTRRGWSGRVVSAKGDVVKIGLPAAGMAAPKEVTIKLNDKTVIRHYAPDSIRFADAKTGTIAQVVKDDQVRVIGEKNAEGTEMVAEEIVFGTFRNTAAIIVSINAETGEIQAKNWETNKPLTIRTAADSQMKRLPEFFSRMAAGGGMRQGGAPGGAPGGGGPGMRPGGGAPGAGGGPGGPGAMTGQRPGGGATPDLAAMLERMPQLKVSDFKVGDHVVVSHTKGAKSDEITAITMLSGVEGILAAQQQANAARGPSMSGGGGGGGGMDLGFPSMVP